MLFNGKLDYLDIAVIEKEKRKEKLLALLEYAKSKAHLNCIYIGDVCKELNIEPTQQELDWIANQLP